MELMFIKRMIRTSVVILATLSVFAIGCDDGGKRRQPLKKNEALPGVKTTGEGGEGSASSDGTPTAADASQQAEHDQVSGQIQGLSSGLTLTLINKNDLVEGSYKLVSIGTGLQIYTTGSKLEVSAFRMQSVSLDSADAVIISEDPTQSAGLLTTDTDSGRRFEVPMSFEVAKSSGQFLAERQAFKGFFTLSTTLKSAVSGGQTGVNLENILGEARGNSAAVKASVQELLTTNGVENSKDLKYTVEDSGVTIDLRIHKVSESRIHLNFEVVEEKDVKLRFVTLVYDITPKAEPTPAPAAESTTPAVDANESTSFDLPATDATSVVQDDDQTAPL